METPESQSPFIYPAVKKAVAWLAGLALACALAAAGASALALLFALQGMPEGVMSCGGISQFLSRLLAVCLGLLFPWCHHVLLAGRGSDITRWLASFCTVLALIVLVCALYTACTLELLLPRQDDVALLLLMLMFFITLFNLPRMAAAPAGLRAALALGLLFLLLAELSDLPMTLLPCALFKLAAAALLFPQLRRLRAFAPRIIGMPGRDEPPHPRHHN